MPSSSKIFSIKDDRFVPSLLIEGDEDSLLSSCLFDGLIDSTIDVDAVVWLPSLFMMSESSRWSPSTSCKTSNAEDKLNSDLVSKILLSTSSAVFYSESILL